MPRKHLLPIVILLLYTSILSLKIFYSPCHMGSDNILIELSVLSKNHPDVFPNSQKYRTIFNRARGHLYYILLTKLDAITEDPILTQKIIYPAIVLTSLLSFYFFFYFFSKRRYLSTLFSVITLLPRKSIGQEFWGLGEFKQVVARSIYLPIVPILILILYFAQKDKRMYLFAALLVGLSAGFHPISALYFFLFISLFIVSERIRFTQKILLGLECTLMFLIGSSYFTIPFLTAESTSSAINNIALFNEAVKYRWYWAFLPKAFEAEVLWKLFYELIPLFVSITLLKLYKRSSGMNPTSIDVIYFIKKSVFFVLIVAIVLPLTQELLIWLFNIRIILYENFRFFRYFYFLIIFYIFIEICTIQKLWKSVILLTAIGILFIHSFSWQSVKNNYYSAKHTYYHIFKSVDIPQIPPTMEEGPDIIDLANFAKRETPPDTIFLFDSALFALISHRTILTSFKEGGWIYYMGPKPFLLWYEIEKIQYQIYFESRYGLLDKLLESYPVNYVVWPFKDHPLDDFPLVFENQTFQVYEITRKKLLPPF